MAKLYKFIFFCLLVFVANTNVFAQSNGQDMPFSIQSAYATYPIFSAEDILFGGKEVSNFTNYPNPAATRTTVAYTLSQKTAVNLRVIDLAGKQLAVLIKANQAAGKHEFNWEFANNNISPGMYILILQADGKSFTRKVIVQ